MSDASQRLAAAIEEHAANVERFKRGEISTEEFRPLRLGMGLYPQLPEVKNMQRVKIPGGRISAAELDALAEVTDRWAKGLAHMTTRQDLQLHHLELDDSADVQRALLEGGLTTVGACGDAVRNVTASPFAGVLEDELFDVTPHAHAVTQHFLFHEHNRKLPRKFKIGFSGSRADHAQVMINDIGLFAAEQGGERGFRVYIAGGLGTTPEIAHLWLEFVPERALLAVCEAVVSVFFRDGERKNRKKNRLKFLLRKLGEAELVRRLDEERARIEAERGEALAAALARLAAECVEPAPRPLGAGAALGDAAFARFRRGNVIAQKQAGYCAVVVKLPLGDITGAQLRALASLARLHGNGEVRATNTQNFVLRWVPEAELVALHRGLALAGLAEPDADRITDVVSCPGGDYCSLAVTRSMKLGAEIRAFFPEGDALVEQLGAFSIKVSGCPNSCGQHQVADVGMTGLMIKGKDGVERPHYALRIGGGCGPDARIGERLDGRVPEEETPRLVAAIARHYLAERAEGESFRDFVLRVGAAEVRRVAFDAAPGVT
jgi:sulfite reductase beta subunit-like hemoprotein